jgi:hypothetical protein
MSKKKIYNLTSLEISKSLFPEGYEVEQKGRFCDLQDSELQSEKAVSKKLPKLLKGIPEGASVLLSGTLPMIIPFLNRGFEIWIPIFDMTSRNYFISKLMPYYPPSKTKKREPK